MKKNLLFIISLFIISNVAISQTAITITQSDMPTIGMIAIEVRDTICTGITVGNAGAQQTWNFTNIVNIVQDTTTFVAPSTVPGNSNFPTSNIASISSMGQNSFYKLDASSLDMLGMNQTFPIIGSTFVVLNPGEKMISFPATYQTTYSGVSTATNSIAYTQIPLVDSLKFVLSATYTFEIDGWGTVTTPSYANASCLREKMNFKTTINSYAHSSYLGWQSTGAPQIDSTITYFWWSDTINHPIVTIEATGTGSITDAKYLLNPLTGVANNVLHAKKNIAVYPNPTSDNINISGITEISTIVITDISGRMVSNTVLYKNNSSINISNLNDGIYFYNVIDINGKSISKGKFAVTK